MLASKHAGDMSRSEAEQQALLFGLQQTHRLLQEKVDVASNFPMQGMLPEENRAGRGKAAGLKSKLGEDIVKAWTDFRLRRIVKMAEDEATILRKKAMSA